MPIVLQIIIGRNDKELYMMKKKCWLGIKRKKESKMLAMRMNWQEDASVLSIDFDV